MAHNTYIPTEERWRCLSNVLDLGSRRLIGSNVDDNVATPVVADVPDAVCHLRRRSARCVPALQLLIADRYLSGT